ncbi:DUF2510 domain-containing protein [Agromyces lapidis]|uniref:DUF2510 domain-containing protein n=1 Tax=Agromyces lapidis TaxID=279574 RepID=A0ABV5SMX4_9MICO|nr:DUF2510 domain-containing protein [Agromyces lapidis]
MTTTQQAPAGWYPDPEHTGQMRWWDGNQWAAPQPAPIPAKNTPALVGTIIGGAAILFIWAPVIAWALALTAMVFATVGNHKSRTIRVGRGLAFIGLTLATIAVVVSIIMLTL